MKNTTIAVAKTSPQDRENISVDVTTQYRRPSDLIVAVLAGLAFLLSLLIFLASRGYLPLGGLLFAARDFLPDSLTPFLGLVLESGALALIVLAMLAALPLAGPRLARNLALGGVLAWLSTWVIRLVLESQGAGSLLDRMLQFPKTGEGLLPPAVAVAAALLLIADPYSNGRTRPLWWGLVIAVVGLAVLVGSYGLLGILGALALGFLIGAVSNLLLGVPREDVSTRVIRQAFQEHGTQIKSVSRVRADARASVPYFARSDSGDEYFVKMIGPDQRDADFLFKLWRTVLLKRVAGSAPFLTPTQQIEHEAYLTLVAQKQQVRTPDIEFTARVAGDYALLAQKRVVARGLADLRDEELSDSLLSAIWTQVRNLHAARIYHGDLRTANLLVDRANQPWIIDFGFAAAGADDAVLGQDTAQVLASLAALAGAERTVESALQVLGPDPLRAALPALQPLALSSATREDLRYDPDLLDELKEALEADVGPLPAQDQESVFRIQRRDVLLVLGLGVGVYALFPQLAQFQQIVKAWTAVNPIWIALGLVGSFITYLSSAIAQQGALVKPLSFWRLLLVQFAATFGSRFSPQGVGAAYVIVRFLEKSGITRETAVTALAVKTTAGVVDHFILVGIVLALLGYSGASFFKGIQLWQIAAAVALIAAIIVVLRWKFPDRVDRAKQALRSSLHDLVTVLENPLRALELFGGSLAITLGYLVTFTICLWATGINISLIQIAAAFLGGSIIGSASPTPGGLGTVEAALVAALAVFGVSAGQAVAAVLLYRLLTFWLPIIPGFFAFRRLQHRNYL